MEMNLKLSSNLKKLTWEFEETDLKFLKRSNVNKQNMQLLAWWSTTIETVDYLNATFWSQNNFNIVLIQ